MKITPFDGFGNYGVYIDGLDFEHLTDDEWMEIGKLHLKSLVTIIRNCNLPPSECTKWTDKWGSRRYSGIFTICRKYPHLSAKNVIELALKGSSEIQEFDRDTIRNRFRMRGEGGTQRVSDSKDARGRYTGLFPGGELYWHSNESGNIIFAPGVALLGSENMVGSATGFMQTADYYQDIPDSLRRDLDQLVVVHCYKPGTVFAEDIEEQDKLLEINMSPESESQIPLVVESPGGIPGLHFSFNTADRFLGLSSKESEDLFSRIKNELKAEKYTFDHWYKGDKDWVLFDNSITNHRRLGKVPGRLAYRLQCGYEKIQTSNYNPYKQNDFALQYSAKLNNLERFMTENFYSKNV